ncbi:hypothetical protein NUSPORA_01293 [Nucleospora cyclopteri]
MKFFMVSKTKRNLDLLTEENVLKSSVRRGIDYDIINEVEWNSIKDEYDLEIECNTIYKCTIYFLSDEEKTKFNNKSVHESMNTEMHKELKNNFNNYASMHNTTQKDKNNNTINTEFQNVDNEVDFFENLHNDEETNLNHKVNNLQLKQPENSSVNDNNGIFQYAVKSVLVFGLELIYDSIASLFISPNISFEKFNSSFTVLYNNNEIDPRLTFDAIIDESKEEIVLHVNRKNANNIVLSTKATTENNVSQINANEKLKNSQKPINKEDLKCSGLSNLGNTCYLNSSLQCLFNLKKLSNAIIYSKKFNDTKYKKVLVEYRNLLLTLLMNGNICAKRLRHTIISINSDFDNYEEQDAQEFLSSLLDMMHEGTVIEKYDNMNKMSLISQLFFGKTVTTIECMDCGTQAEKIDHFALLSLPIPIEVKNIIVSSRRIATVKVKEGITVEELKKRIRLLLGSELNSTDINGNITFNTNKITILEYINNNFVKPYKKSTIQFKNGVDFVAYEYYSNKKYAFAKLYIRTFFFLFTKHPYDILIDISDIKECSASGLINVYYKQLVNKIFSQLRCLMNLSITLESFESHLKIKASSPIVVEGTTWLGLELYFYRHFEIFGNRLNCNMNVSIYDCIFKFIEDEVIEYSCENRKCAKIKHKAVISTDFMTLPKYLVLHLKRFTYTGTKISNFVDFDREIYLQSKNGRNRYSLVAVICHFKVGIWYGHYAAYVLKDNKWICCNDNVISKLDVDKKNAYILFYEERNDKNK